MRQVRCYHRWAMKVFFFTCDPLLRDDPSKVPEIRKSLNDWLDCHEKRR